MAAQGPPAPDDEALARGLLEWQQDPARDPNVSMAEVIERGRALLHTNPDAWEAAALYVVEKQRAAGVDVDAPDPEDLAAELEDVTARVVAALRGEPEPAEPGEEEALREAYAETPPADLGLRSRWMPSSPALMAYMRETMARDLDPQRSAGAEGFTPTGERSIGDLVRERLRDPEMNADEQTIIEGRTVTGRQLAECRQHLAHEGAQLPRWDDLDDNERDMATVVAAGWLRATRLMLDNAVRSAPGEPVRVIVNGNESLRLLPGDQVRVMAGDDLVWSVDVSGEISPAPAPDPHSYGETAPDVPAPRDGEAAGG